MCVVAITPYVAALHSTGPFCVGGVGWGRECESRLDTQRKREGAGGTRLLTLSEHGMY